MGTFQRPHASADFTASTSGEPSTEANPSPSAPVIEQMSMRYAIVEQAINDVPTAAPTRQPTLEERDQSALSFLSGFAEIGRLRQQRLEQRAAGAQQSLFHLNAVITEGRSDGLGSIGMEEILRRSHCQTSVDLSGIQAIQARHVVHTDERRERERDRFA